MWDSFSEFLAPYIHNLLPMKFTVHLILISILTTLLFFSLQFVSAFVHFGLFGSGTQGEKYSLGVAFCFVVIQILVTVFIYIKKKPLFYNVYIFLINIALLLSLFVFFILLPEN